MCKPEEENWSLQSEVALLVVGYSIPPPPTNLPLLFSSAVLHQLFIILIVLHTLFEPCKS